MDKNQARELRSRRAEVLRQAEALVTMAEEQDRDLTDEERSRWDAHLADVEQLDGRIERLENMPDAAPQGPQDGGRNIGMPAYNRIGRGDNETRAMAHYIRTGDTGGVRDLLSQERDADSEGSSVAVRLPGSREMRVVDSIMNITAAADGGAAVPTGFAGTIAMRRNEIRLADRLGVRMVPGTGTTVNYPYENADPTAFSATSEQDDSYAQTYTRDVAPVLANKAFTLAKKTKKLALTEELFDDEDANLLAHVADSIGRALGVTHNALLLTEVAANGTSLKTYASASAIAAGEPEDIVFGDTIGYYLDDGNQAAWVMRPSTFGNVASITGSSRLYAETPGGAFNREILGYPVYYSNQAAATAASAKDMYFGNWYYVGMREDPALRMIRDPYTTDGIVYLKYSMRVVYGVLIAGAVGYGVHPSA